MFRVHAPAAGRRAGVIALTVMVGVLAARASFAQQPPAQAAPAKNPYVFASDGALLLQFIKADKTADFEMIMAKVKEALNKSDKPERKEQAKSWKLFKAAEAGAGGAAIYVSIIEPAVKGADYTVSTILAEGFPTEANALYKTYAEVFGNPPGNLLNLTLVSDLGK
ncbi:MAG TPA: hypothetical protein VH417_12770 [Vicinamibacterales bacterium]